MKRLILNYLVIEVLVSLAVFTSCKKDDEENTNVDVYVVGDNFSTVNSVGTIWKNGIAQNLTDSYQARSVYVSGSDVYVVGSGSIGQDIPICAKLWKNGVALKLPVSNGACANSVYVSDNDVYTVGYEYNNFQGGIFAKLWKYGVTQNLNDENNYANAYSIHVSDNDVYIECF